MKNEHQGNAELAALAGALSDLRDTWQLLGMILQDQLIDAPSAARDAALSEVEQQLESIRNSVRGSLCLRKISFSCSNSARRSCGVSNAGSRHNISRWPSKVSGIRLNRDFGFSLASDASDIVFSG
jgi:hypothetical protein